jgi:hypothetical protein
MRGMVKYLNYISLSCFHKKKIRIWFIIPPLSAKEAVISPYE